MPSMPSSSSPSSSFCRHPCSVAVAFASSLLGSSCAFRLFSFCSFSTKASAAMVAAVVVAVASVHRWQVSKTFKKVLTGS